MARVRGVAVTIILVAALTAVQTGGSARRGAAKLAFACNGSICVMNADGSARRRLTRDQFIDSYPAWSPDGRTIAFTGALARWVLYAIRSDGTARARLSPRGADDAYAAWSPDGRTIAFDDNLSGQIDLMSARGGDRRALTRQSGSLPAWSPDGRRIAFVTSPGRSLALTTGDIAVVGADGSHRRMLVHDGTFPAWSPDGTELAFLRNRPGSTRASVWTVRADRSGLRLLVPRAEQGGGLSWSPDGEHVAFSFDGEIFDVDTDGTELTQLTHCCGDNLDPAWQRIEPGSRRQA